MRINTAHPGSLWDTDALQQLVMLWRVSDFPDQAGENIRAKPAASVVAADDHADLGNFASTGCGCNTYSNRPAGNPVGHWSAAAAGYAVACTSTL
jgi:hypothetical protein